ncbi:MAG: Bug family tripartite tricarboxylate transporter substrate binding protein [Advenella sp.]|uniref:Bug family tripartite tricarboxylate transporter substrate binding protein n=1 Tax=Advenella sp. TaxID=1872388 RepID=UPI003F95A472
MIVKKNTRWDFRALFAVGILLVTTLPFSNSYAWEPTRPVDLVVHTGPGGGSDLLSRTIATIMQKDDLIPTRIQVVNRTGGNGAVAAAYTLSKKNDPYTLVMVNTVWIANSLTSKEASITLHDLKPIAELVRDPAVIAVRADSPYKTLKDFIEAAKAAPGTLKQSGGSVTSRDNLVRQLLQHESGAQWKYVSFQGGGERLAALLGGHVDMMVIEPQEAGEQVRAGTIRLLARVTDMPLSGAGYENVPTLAEAGYQASPAPQIRAIMAPPQMPDEAVRYWVDKFKQLKATDSWKESLHDSQLEDSFTDDAGLARSIVSVEKSLREQYKIAGVPVVR